MMKKLSASRGLMVGLLVLGLLAAGTIWYSLAQPSDEDSPTPSIAAQAREACDHTANADFDVAVIVSGNQGTVEWEYEISGDDYHVTGTRKALDGSLLVKGEFIQKDSVVYRRLSSSLDDPDDFEDWGVSSTEGDRPDFPFACISNSGSVQASVEADGFKVFDIRSSDTSTLAGEFVGDSTVIEVATNRRIWVDDAGYITHGCLVQADATIVDNPTCEYTSNLTYPFGNGIQVLAKETYSGFGEPNIITAPITPPEATQTPTPTATVEATATPTPTATATHTPTPTAIPTDTPTPTPEPEATATPTPIPSQSPTAVQNLSISNSGLVRWDAPEDASGLRNYRVYVKNCSRSGSLRIDSSCLGKQGDC